MIWGFLKVQYEATKYYHSSIIFSVNFRLIYCQTKIIEMLKPKFFFFQLQKLVVGGELPCSKEDVATLASIQLHIEEAWPEDNLPNYTKSDLALFNKKLLDSHKYLSKTPDPQENLRRRKELIRNNRALRITQSRRKGRLVRQLTCVSDHDENSHNEVDLSQFLPPDFTTSKKIRYIIQVCLWEVAPSPCELVT